MSNSEAGRKKAHLPLSQGGALPRKLVNLADEHDPRAAGVNADQEGIAVTAADISIDAAVAVTRPNSVEARVPNDPFAAPAGNPAPILIVIAEATVIVIIIVADPDFHIDVGEGRGQAGASDRVDRTV
jgi:hypothetical protein